MDKYINAMMSISARSGIVENKNGMIIYRRGAKQISVKEIPSGFSLYSNFRVEYPLRGKYKHDEILPVLNQLMFEME